MATGDEILIVDANDTDREGLRAHFDGLGYVCSCVSTGGEMRALVAKKVFPLIIVDLDVDRTGGGVECLRFVREQALATSVVILSNRRSFEAAVEGFRLGVSDILIKKPDQIPAMTQAVTKALDRAGSRDKDSGLFLEVKAVLEESLRILLRMSRELYAGEPVSAAPPRIGRVLFVDHNDAHASEFDELRTDKSIELIVEVSGGGALDKASLAPFDVVVAREQLSDLPGAMLVKSVQSMKPETIGFIFTEQGKNGVIETMKDGRVVSVEKPYGKTKQLVESVERAVENFRRVDEERHTIHVFRKMHGAFLKRYAELKQRVDPLTRES